MYILIIQLLIIYDFSPPNLIHLVPYIVEMMSNYLKRIEELALSISTIQLFINNSSMNYLPIKVARLVPKSVKLQSLSQSQKLTTLATADTNFTRKGMVEEKLYVRKIEDERKILDQRNLESLKLVSLEAEENDIDTRRKLYSFQLR